MWFMLQKSKQVEIVLWSQVTQKIDIFNRDRYSLPASEVYKGLSTKFRNKKFFIKLICQLLF